MDFIQDRLGFPRRLGARLWLISLPSAVVSFERRSDVPKLPSAGSRAVGLALLLGAAVAGFVSVRQPNTRIAYEGPLAPVVSRPGTLAGLAGLGGLAFLLRSTTLLLYAAGLAALAGTGRLELEEPTAGKLLGRE